MSFSVQLSQTSSSPVAVIRRQVRQSELSRVVPECCGIVWNAVRAQQAKGGRHVAIYWDSSIRLEVGVELLGPFAEQAEVCLSATPAGTVAWTTHFGPVRRTGCRAQRRARVVRGPRPAPRWSELGNLRPLAAGVEQQSVADSH